jgi:hypothetical protein
VKKKNEKTEKLIEICNHCGSDVSFGSGKFINRVPDFNDIRTRIEYDRINPYGNFVCENCDSRSLTGNDI